MNSRRYKALVIATCVAPALAFALNIGAMAQTVGDEEKRADARRAAAVAKREADYAAARQKCEVFAGEVKINCVNNAKARFDKR